MVDDKGGSESSVKIAKADLVPTEYNLLGDYACFDELSKAAQALADRLNARPHAVTRRAPAEMLEVERQVLHAIPDAPYSAAFGESRTVGWSATISYRGARYSVPDRFCDTGVWVRTAGGEVIIVAGEGAGAKEVARHRLLGPGQASILDEHYPTRKSHDPLIRTPRPTKPSEAAFLALGEGAKLYLVEAAAIGARRIEARMAEAVTLSALHPKETLDRALGVAAMAGRFAEGDLGSIIVHGSGACRSAGGPPTEHSLAAGTAMWSALGTDGDDDDAEERS